MDSLKLKVTLNQRFPITPEGRSIVTAPSVMRSKDQLPNRARNQFFMWRLLTPDERKAAQGGDGLKPLQPKPLVIKATHAYYLGEPDQHYDPETGLSLPALNEQYHRYPGAILAWDPHCSCDHCQHLTHGYCGREGGGQ